MSHIEVIRDLRLSNSGELNVMSDDQANHVIEVPIENETDFDGELNEGFIYYADEDHEVDFDGELNDAVIYDYEDPEHHDILYFLNNCFEKRSKLDELNSRSPRYFQIIYVKEMLKNIEHKLITL